MSEERLPGGELTKTKKIHVYHNGDKFNVGKDLVINPKKTRTYDALLEQMTSVLDPRFGAVRCLRTPDTGNIVQDLGDLEHGKSYVACAKHFSKLGYRDIRDPPVKHPPPMDLTSPRERKRFAISGRIKKVHRNPITLNVYTNGEPLVAARRVLIQPWIHKTWEVILELINSKISLRSGALRRLLHLPEKNIVNSGAELISQDFYVAIGSERFKDFEYGLNPTVIFSPQQQQARRYPALAPLKGRSSNTTSGMSGSTVASTTTNKSDHSTTKPRKTQPKPARGVNGHDPPKEEEGIPVKPLKHKRTPVDGRQHGKEPPAKKTPPTKANENKTPEKSVKELDLDKDESGVYRSKNESQKADGIEEDNETEREVPIDAREAEEVADDDEVTPRTNSQKSIRANSVHSNRTGSTRSPRKEPENDDGPVNDKTENGSPPPKQLTEDEAATKIQAQYRGYKTRKELAEKVDKEKTLGDNPAAPEATSDPAMEAATEPAKEEETADELDEAAREIAAIKIQSTYRGYRVRRDLTHRKKEEKKKEEVEDSVPDQPTSEDEEREKAAIKIEARKELENPKTEVEGDKIEKAENGEPSSDGEKPGVTGEVTSKLNDSESAQPTPVETQG